MVSEDFNECRLTFHILPQRHENTKVALNYLLHFVKLRDFVS